MSSSSSSNNSSTAALNDGQWQQLNQLTQSMSDAQLTWASGYLAGLAQVQVTAALSAAPLAAVENRAAPSLTILYGSQTGNAKGVAEELKASLEQQDIAVKAVNMADYKAKNLKHETHVAIVVSTHGEGDAPDDAVELHEFLASKKAPRLENLKYAVFALGDSSYEYFCQTGKEFDQRLNHLGAKPLFQRVDCDVEFDAEAKAWRENLSKELKQSPRETSQVVAMPVQNKSTPVYSRKDPFTATLGQALKITGRDSVKDIRHIEISLAGSGIDYQPGDALGVWFNNDEALVDELLGLLDLDPGELIDIKEERLALKSALLHRLELTQSYPTFITKYIADSGNSEVAKLMEDKPALREYLAKRQIVDIVREYPGSLSAQQLVDALRPISARLYSIASSQLEVEDEVHLTVAMVDYHNLGQARHGGASSFLGRRLQPGDEVNVFVERNNNFRLPEDPQTPVIMIGPGTGIAPFRAFLQERDNQDAEGKNWLFFGNPNYTQDFLYQVELQRFVKDGVLDRVSLAFSRDQEEKRYVQHKLLEQGDDVYQWLEQGAHIYICGDANRMAKDVHDALVQVVATHGHKSEEDAAKYLNDMRRAKRFQKDVY